eukprot:TRINITY_DN16427_c0_g1_i1.p1 TRINITY_DN16427_c0_g1~~TRINITY_DN16427_c0_g1_i1.p1  ORF type:complete len:591 (+),score=208.39 TRINITY_DN16427_c0_g1_i1:87-1859(+)
MADEYPYDVGGYVRAGAGCVWERRGLLWAYGYNHEEAVRCYKMALEDAPCSAFAAWGVAYCVGPNYNKPWEMFEAAEKAACMKIAYEYTQAAAKHAVEGTVAGALVEALQARYPTPEATGDMEDYNLAYAEKMEAVYRAFPEDLDVAALFAEAVMGLRPWALWDTATGAPAFEWTTKAVRALEEGLAAAKGRGVVHPGLCHFYIHAMELSRTPGKALEASLLLEPACPDAGHLIHMPSHIYIQVGMYDEAVRSNAAAVAADAKYLADATPGRGMGNFYSIYRFHDAHFLAWAAMFQGNYAVALAAAEALNASVPAACLTAPWRDEVLGIDRPPMADWAESFLATYIHVQVRFGKWRALLEEDAGQWEATDASGVHVYTSVRAFLAYAKGVAAAALSGAEAAGSGARRALLEAARQHHRDFMEKWAYLKRETPGRTTMNNQVAVILAVAEKVLIGELTFREGDVDAGLAALQQAVALYDGGADPDTGLVYDEPWGWMMPARHILGALALEAGRAELALTAYEEDLGLSPAAAAHPHYPRNVWSLRGLLDASHALGRPTGDLQAQFDAAAARADVPIVASCLCQAKRPCCGA